MEVKTIWKTKSAHCPGGSSWSPALTVVNISSPDFEGTFAATIACKRWDRNKNLLAYLDFDDGRKIMTSAWSEKNYLGLADIPLNTCVSVSFQFSAKGISYLRSVEVI